jgi:hypothetical protein
VHFSHDFLWVSQLDNIFILWTRLTELKLRHCEKAKKFEKISHLFWPLLSNVKTSGRFFQIFVAFLDNLNFTEVMAEVVL